MERKTRFSIDKLDQLGLKVEAVLGIGAEAVLLRCRWRGYEVVAKYRLSKSYRIRELDESLRRNRTVLEAKLLATCRRLGVPAPSLLYIEPEMYVLLMDYIPGKRLIDVLAQLADSSKIFERLGVYVGRLHSNGVVHGDLTLANIIMHEDREYLIDFGLGAFTYNVEDQGVDVHLLLRSIESTFPSLARPLYHAFLKGYGNVRGEEEKLRIRQKVREIRMRGRYIAERRITRIRKD